MRGPPKNSDEVPPTRFRIPASRSRKRSPTGRATVRKALIGQVGSRLSVVFCPFATGRPTCYRDEPYNDHDGPALPPDAPLAIPVRMSVIAGIPSSVAGIFPGKQGKSSKQDSSLSQERGDPAPSLRGVPEGLTVHSWSNDLAGPLGGTEKQVVRFRLQQAYWPHRPSPK